MAPTEILAEQHEKTLKGFLEPLGLRVGRLVGSMTAKQKRETNELLQAGLLDVIVGNCPVKFDDEEKDKTPVKSAIVDLLAEQLGIEEEDLLSAELEVVPAGPARDLGLDRSMILGYGHDDSSCAYPSLVAQLECEARHNLDYFVGLQIDGFRRYVRELFPADRRRGGCWCRCRLQVILPLLGG
jgi:aspartyl aminopeptidase